MQAINVFSFYISNYSFYISNLLSFFWNLLNILLVSSNICFSLFSSDFTILHNNSESFDLKE